MLGHVTEGRLDEGVWRVAQKVPKHACLSDGNSFGGEADLGGVWGLAVGGIQVEVCDVPEPGWRHEGGVITRVHVDLSDEKKAIQTVVMFIVHF